MTAQITEQARHMNSVTILLERQAYTDEPYRKILRAGVLPRTAAAPMIRIPVPKKKEDTTEIPKYLLKITFRKAYRLAQPRLMIIFPRMAQIREPALTSKDALVKMPAAMPPIR